MHGSASTRNRYRAVLKHMLRRYPELIIPSVRYGAFQFPRCLSLEPELNQRDVRLTEQQERDLITHMGDDLRTLFIMACDTGLRRGSLCQLRAKHINLKSRTIIVPASIQKQKRTQKLPMTDRVYSLLEVRLSKVGVRKPLFKWNHGRRQRHRASDGMTCAMSLDHGCWMRRSPCPPSNVSSDTDRLQPRCGISIPLMLRMKTGQRFRDWYEGEAIALSGMSP